MVSCNRVKIVHRHQLALWSTRRAFWPIRTFSTATSPVLQLDPNPSTPYQLYTKRDIPRLLSRYAPRINPLPYYAAATVFPMRVTNYVVENLIDW
jgi:hypothetical protein